MAANSVTDQSSTIDFPDEIICNILLHSSTPSFIQLIRTSKQFYNCAKDNRQLILYHLRHIPGPKDDLTDSIHDNLALFQLLRQRATNNLYGINFTANVTEYLARYTQLNLGASCISGLDADYVRHALCFENSVDIRQYTSNCLVKEKISQQPNTKILKTVQWGRFLSVLCAYKDGEDIAEDFLDEEDSDRYDSDSDSASEPEAEWEDRAVEKAGFAPSVNAFLESKIKYTLSSRAPGKRKPPRKVKDCKYRICHYDIYTLEDSATFMIDGQRGLVPKDFIVQTCLFCAILWDKDIGNGRPTKSAKIVVYVARETQMYYAPKYDEQIIWPKKPKPSRASSTHSDDEDETTESSPERIAFFRDGRRIKMYTAGGVVPFKVFSSFLTDDERSYVSSNVVHYGGLDSIDFYVDTPFYGMHGKYYDDHAQQEYCYQTYLCLGTSRLNFGQYDGNTREANVLCILRSQTKMDTEDCDHKVSLQRMAHLSAQSSSIVARLWGWEELHTNLTGKEAIAVSSGGTRIAIAVWDKILVYAINPKVLCEETVVDSSDDENEKSKKKKRKAVKTWEYPATEYYHRIKDENLLDMNVAQLRPVVLDLAGAVAHRMHWSPAKGKITDTALVVDEKVIPDPEEDENVNQVEENSSVSSSSNTGSDTVTPESDLSILQEQSSATEGVDGSALTPDGNTDAIPPTHTDVKCTEEDHLENSMVMESHETSGLDEPALTGSQQLILLQPKAQSSIDEDVLSDVAPTISNHETSSGLVSGLTLSDINTNIHSPSLNVPPAIGNAGQGSKLSARKKDKYPEGNNENANPGVLVKDKIVSGFTVTEHSKPKFNNIGSTPSSPVMSKTCPKPKQTVAEALAVSNAMPIVTNGVAEADSKPFPAAPTANSQTQDTIRTTTEDIAGVASDLTTIVTDAKVEQADHSKSAISMELEQSETLSEKVQEEGGQEKEAQPKRRKRVTEDELIVLTDRGIQIWNLGPRAKGIRPRPRGLPMEEALAGRIPLLKQNQVDSEQPDNQDDSETW